MANVHENRAERLEPVALGAEVARRIRALRQDRGWSQRQLAAYLNVTHDRLCKYEAGRLPPLGVLVKLARLTGMPLDLLVPDPELDPAQAELRERLRRLLAVFGEERAAAVPLLDTLLAMWHLMQAGRRGTNL